VTRRRKKKRGGGAARNPNSLANLRRGPQPGLRPAPRGNTRALRHGGRAEITIPGLDAARREILDRLAASAPVRDETGGLPAADEATVELAARALARHRSVDNWLAAHGVLDEMTGEPKKAAEYAESSARTADGLLAKLGMNPKDRAALGVDIQRGFDLAAHWAEQDGSDDAIDAEAEEVEE
jgi:hypothetical protein